MSLDHTNKPLLSGETHKGSTFAAVRSRKRCSNKSKLENGPVRASAV